MIIKLMPELGNKKFVATCDHEFIKILQKFCNKAQVGLCEIHETRLIGRWVQKHLGEAKCREDIIFPKICI